MVDTQDLCVCKSVSAKSCYNQAEMLEPVDRTDLKSVAAFVAWEFESPSRH